MKVSLSLSDSDAAILGLMCERSQAMPWFLRTLERCFESIQSEAQLVERAVESNLDGVLTALLRREGLWGKLQHASRFTLLRSNLRARVFGATLYAYCEQLDTYCRQEQIVYALLKGLATGSQLYRDPLERYVSDIDVLVSRQDVVKLYRWFESQGFIAGSFDVLKRCLVPVPTDQLPLDRGYDLPRLWREFPIDVDDASEILVGPPPTRRFAQTASGVVARVPIEVHFRLADQLDITWSPTPFKLFSGVELFSVDHTVHLLFLMYKAYVDLVVFGNPKSAKLVSDVMRMLDQAQDKIDRDRLAQLSREHSLEGIVGYFLRHASSICGINTDGMQEFVSSRPRSGVDLGDFLPSLASGPRIFSVET